MKNVMTDLPPAPDSARMLALVLDALPVGVWIMNHTGRITHGNPAGQRIWGGARYVTPEQFGQYKGWWADTGAPIAPEEWAAARAIRHGETSIDEVIDIECFDGSRKTILNSALPIHGPDGTVVGAIIVNQDITERRREELQRDELLQQLQKALSEIDTLSGLLPICAGCKKIRNDGEQWEGIESFIRRRSSAEFTHTLCPDCLVLHDPDETV